MNSAFSRNLLVLAAITPYLSAQTSRPASRAAQAERSGATAQTPQSRPTSPDALAHQEQIRRDRLGREISALFVKLGSRSKTTSREARDAIIEVCSRERVAGLGYEAEKLYAWYRRYWVERATAVVDVRVEHTTLLGMDTVPVSLGVGGTVNIQLPRTRSIGIGTTVPIPVGGGR